MELGYCCINQTLRNAKPFPIYCSRSLIKRTFNLLEASNRALQNCKDLLTILKWNESHGIKVFRISSDLFPRYTCSDCSYSFEALKDYKEIMEVLAKCGKFAYDHNHMLSFHPGPFTTLGSPNESAAQSGIREVEYHTLLVSLIDPLNLLDIPINYHIGGSYGGEYIETAKRFINRFKQLSSQAQKLSVIENDDKVMGWSVKQLYELIYIEVGIPITFDIHHYLFKPDNQTMYEAFKTAEATWCSRSMQVHYSQSPTASKLIPKHSDYYRDLMPDFIDGNIHCHLECKQKELALLHYRTIGATDVIRVA